MQKPYYIFTAKRKYKGKLKTYYTYTITTSSGLPDIVCQSHTRKGIQARNKTEAGQKVFELINNLLETHSVRSDFGSFGDYSKDYMVDGKCPIQRFIESEGKTRDKGYMREYRKIYENHVERDMILCGTPMEELNHGTLLRFRERLVEKLGVCSTSRKSFKIVKQIR